MDKTCFVCLVAKPRSEFYAHKTMADGLLGKCKECTRLAVRKNREAKADLYKAYDRVRYYRDGIRAITKPSAVARERWLTNNREKRRAHNAVNNALRRGSLHKPASCQRCGNSGVRLHGHHDDYSKPLDVEWICPGCHGLEHRRYTQEDSERMALRLKEEQTPHGMRRFMRGEP